MNITIVTTGRFHVCDLARELNALGHKVTLISCVPKRITRRVGLPNHCSRSLFLPLAPLFFLFKKGQKTLLRDQTERIFHTAFDRVASARMRRCDVLIGMSGIAGRTAYCARRQYGASIWIERGSRHILSQKRIMEDLPGSAKITDFMIQRELIDYQMSDTLVVPSNHVVESFLECGFKAARLFRNPYGVDLTMFPPTAVPPGTPPTILSVGTWCLRKGSDTLLAAWRTIPGVRLVHVGPVGDLQLPADPNFVHVDPVPQWKLVSHYSQAHVFALPSREEGLAVVQAQALACGLHLVCSQFSGGADYAPLFPDSNRIRVCPNGSFHELAEALKCSLKLALLESGIRHSSSELRDQLSWRAYGRRYEAELITRTGLA